MKLTELEPRWYVFETGGPRVGLTFLCPHCQEQRLGVTFHNQGEEAMDDAYILAKRPAEKIWTLVGPEEFATLTLTPSIDASHVGHWHGFITDGEIQ
jgi:hypothetical protein